MRKNKKESKESKATEKVERGHQAVKRMGKKTHPKKNC